VKTLAIKCWWAVVILNSLFVTTYISACHFNFLTLASNPPKCLVPFKESIIKSMQISEITKSFLHRAMLMPQNWQEVL